MRPRLTYRVLVLATLLLGASFVPVISKEPQIDVGLAPDRMLFLRSGVISGSDGGILAVSSADGSVAALRDRRFCFC